MKGLIFSIKRYSIHDGPGIRVTFFLKGCPLSCWWCHNPEGISPLPQNVEQVERVGEKEFVRVEEAGKYYDIKDILEILDKEKIFISESKGGVTFSGGEPLLQTEFLAEALRACRKNGYHTAVDTSGYAPAENLRTILPFTDMFLFDIKHLDKKKHKLYTGVSSSLVLDNFRIILDAGNDIVVRIPIIPGFNDDEESLGAIKSLLAESMRSNLVRISLLPYHKIGVSKYKKFSMEYRMNGVNQPSKQRMNELKLLFDDTGIPVRIGG
jgi:pyruvate formate lyase activating enzyme